jgi:hypothetical protein
MAELWLVTFGEIGASHIYSKTTNSWIFYCGHNEGDLCRIIREFLFVKKTAELRNSFSCAIIFFLKLRTFAPSKICGYILFYERGFFE